MGFFDFIGDIAGLASAGAGIVGAFKSGKEPKGSAAINAAAERAAQISEALANPSSPMFQNIAAGERDKSREALLETIRGVITQNRRASMRNPSGPSFFINPARRDEAILSAITRGYQNEQQRADDRARGVLQQALGAQPVAQQLAGNQAGFNQDLTRTRAATLPSAFAGVADVLGRLGNSSMFSNLGAGAPSFNINDSVMTNTNRQFGRGAHGLLGSV